MKLRARLTSVSANAAASADAPNKINLKFNPLFLGDADASWLFEHLGQYVDVELAPSMVPRTPLEEAIDRAP